MMDEEWAAVRGEHIEVKADTKAGLKEKLRKVDILEEEVEFHLLPKPHKTIFI